MSYDTTIDCAIRKKKQGKGPLPLLWKWPVFTELFLDGFLDLS